MKILFSCNELGLGHVSRVILLGKRLENRGHEISFFSGGIAYELLRKEFKNVYPCTPIAWYESANGIVVSASVLNILFPLLRFDSQHKRLQIKRSSSDEIIHRYYDLRRYIKKIKPEMIVSDGDPLALRLSKRWKFPSVYITNVIRPSYHFPVFLLPGQRFTERYVRKCKMIIIPDIPKYTICEYNLGNLDDIGIKDKTEFVGSFFDVQCEKGSEEIIFVPISGPLGTRAKMIRQLIPILSRLEHKSVVSLGEPHRDLRKQIGNCEVHGWLTKTERKECMKKAQIVIFSGGHGTCFELIKHGKPSICVPTQPEQKANARKLADLGCSVYTENKKQIRSAIQEIKDNEENFRRNVARLSEYCNHFHGLEKTVALIEDVC